MTTLTSSCNPSGSTSTSASTASLHSERKNQKQTAGNLDVTILEELQQNCTCPVCQEVYSSHGPQRAKLLPGCGHSVCERCADRLCRDVSTVLPCCPLCRTPFKVPAGGTSKLPNNVDATSSLNLIDRVRRLTCRRHPGSTEDLYCESCLKLLCVKCFANDHTQHKVTSVEEAAKNIRDQFNKHIEETKAMEAHLARAWAALKVVKDHASEIQRRVLEEEKSKIKRIEKDTAILLEQLASRLDPLSRNVELGQKTLTQLVQRYQTMKDNPRELVRHFAAVQAEIQRLTELTVNIDVDEIGHFQVDFTPLSLTDWIPADTVNLIGRLTPSFTGDITDDHPTLTDLLTQLDESQKRESSLLTELKELKEHQHVVHKRFNEQAMQQKQQETKIAERDRWLCSYIEMLTTKLAMLDQSKRILENTVEIALQEKTELEKRIVVQEERFETASRRISELEMQVEELKDEINGGRLRQRDLEEQLRTETKWRRSAEEESRRRRHDNEDLITQLGEEQQNAERRYEELQDRVVTMLKNAKEQTRQAVWSACLARETSRQTEDKLTKYTDEICQQAGSLEQTEMT